MLNIKSLEAEENMKNFDNLKGFLDKELSISEIEEETFVRRVRDLINDSSSMDLKADPINSEHNSAERAEREASKIESIIEKFNEQILSLKKENRSLKDLIKDNQEESKHINENLRD